MAHLLLLNGPPGIGKSTLARRWATEHPPTLCCDVDVLRTMIGGWREDFGGAGALIRTAALAFIEAYLAEGHDVVLPQLLLAEPQIDRFEAAAANAGAELRHVVLVDESDAAVARFNARSGADPWHDEVRAIVAEQGGDDVVRQACEVLRDLAAVRPGLTVVPTSAGDVDAAYERLVAAVSG